jgi:hypothetical protein
MAASTEMQSPERGSDGSVGFVRIAQLVPEDQEILSIPVGTPAGRALDLMAANSFDQLPVVNPRKRVIGTFTHRSFARESIYVRTQDDPRSAPVDDMVDELRFVRPSDSLDDVLPWIDADNAVLIGDEENLFAVVTAADVSRFLWRRTRPFVLLQDIELATRALMRSACTADELSSCLSDVLPNEADADPRERLEELTMGELQSVLLHKASYGRYFGVTFGPSRELVQSTLEPVRDVRNKVFHFRDVVSDEDIGTLMRASALLRRRMLIREKA